MDFLYDRAATGFTIFAGGLIVVLSCIAWAEIAGYICRPFGRSVLRFLWGPGAPEATLFQVQVMSCYIALWPCIVCVVVEAFGEMGQETFIVEPDGSVWRSMLPKYLVVVRGCANALIALGLASGLVLLRRRFFT